MGIAGFATLLSSYGILTRELNRGYLATNPASATLRTDKIDDALLAAVAGNRDVSDVEARRAITGRIKAGPAEWRNLTLFVVADFAKIRVGKLESQEGAWPPGTGEILIERDAFQVARTRIGDTVAVKTPAGHEQMLRVTGRIHDVGQAQARMENVVYGYITLDTLSQLGEKRYLDQLSIVVAKNRFDEKHIREVASAVGKLVEGQGHTVRRIDVPAPGKHPHADIMGLLLLSMSGFGLAVLALSGVLVVNMLTALMASQIAQIGVMKAIGGTRWQIARIYFAQATLLGVAAIFVALPVGIWGSRQLCRYLAVFLNFDISSFVSPPWVYALIAIVGIVVPLLAAAYPVLKGSGITVREALADSGVSSDRFGTNTFDRVLAGLGGIFRPVLLAIRNSFRRRTRLALTLVTLAAGGICFMSALNFRASMINTLDRLFASRKFDMSVSLGTMYPWEIVERAVRNTPGVVRAEGWIVTEGLIPNTADSGREAPSHASVTHGGGASGTAAPGGKRFTVIALPVETRLLRPEIAEGRGLRSGDTNSIVLNTALAASGLKIKVGDTLTLRMGPAEMPWHVVGIAREPFSPAVGYVSKVYIDQVGGHQGMANSIRLALDKTDPAAINRVKASLDQNLERAGLRALASASKAESRFSFDQHMLMIYLFLIVASCIIAGVGGLGLMTTMSLNVLERRREMGVLRAIGASPRAVQLIIVAEGVVIGVMSWGLATLIAWPFSKALGDLLMKLMFKSNLDFFFEPFGMLVWLAVSVFLGIVAGFLPAWQSSRTTVREALSHA